MFKAIREFTRNGKTAQTVKEYATFEEALAYARRYGKGGRFLCCTILNEAGSEAYNLYPDGKEEFFNLDDPTETPEEAETQEARETDSQHEASREYMEGILGLPGTSGMGDFETELQFRHEDGFVSVRTIRHRTKNRALAYASTVIKETGSFLCRIEVRFKGVPRWMWEGRWAYQSSTKEQRMKSG